MGLIVVETLKMGLVRSCLTLSMALDMPVKVSLNLSHAPNMYRAGVGCYPTPCNWVVIPVAIHIDIIYNITSSSLGFCRVCLVDSLIALW